MLEKFDDGPESFVDDSDVKSNEAADVPFPDRSMCYGDVPLCFELDIEIFVGDMSDGGSKFVVDDSDVKSHKAADVHFQAHRCVIKISPCVLFLILKKLLEEHQAKRSNA